MIQLVEQSVDLGLVYPSASLLDQVARYLGDDRRFRMRVIQVERPADVHCLWPGEAKAIAIDATERPTDAAAVLEPILEQIGSKRTLLYTEKARHELEILTRSHGVLFVLGPMGPKEWNALLSWLGALDERAPKAGQHPRPLERGTFDARRASR